MLPISGVATASAHRASFRVSKIAGATLILFLALSYVYAMYSFHNAFVFFHFYVDREILSAFPHCASFVLSLLFSFAVLFF